ncbi:RagB/SusD family nutrient uptake outer membrane protein [Hymenobacter ginsengisoli]|uniref:RagB/SusD family nutrient uptake outer membrane protein n=1 Tax=Hymenobacter ginsengisoli TaxID=1051626 RepID=A0ABP8Q0G6_9BACT|nr:MULTISPECIES: RagB/SusD family nutrient uptake outer membrane protein [unclassified Hymenobacter]MBO2032600.1 RagB/SusD family nutrient uptake outer membrane protein [Hymenobacter sp. BT559]
MKNYPFLNPLRGRAVPVLAAAVLALASSCTKYLDVAPLAQPVATSFFQNANDAAVASISTYGKLREWNLVAFNWLAVTTLTSDDAEKGSVSGDAEFLNNFTFFRVTPTDGPLEGFWTGQYQEILLCNQVIQNVPGINMDANLKARYVAEAQFLRALMYFNLVRAFGDVPLYTKPPVTPDELNLARTPKDQVYAFLVSELTAAAAILPATYTSADVGRATKGAALALLSKVQLYQKNWAAALAASDQVIGLGYSLAPDYYKMFRIAGENGPESIFEIQASAVTGNCDASNSQWAQVQGVRNQFGWGFFIPSASLDAAFEAGDKRKMATILYPGETTPEGDVITTSAPNPRYNAKAYVPNAVPYTCNYGDSQNLRVLRLGEVLLINAEAANELGQTAKALTDVNLVRVRAGLAPLASGLSQDAMRQAIWKERRVELALEYGDRYFDLVRQGRAAQVLASKGFVAGKNEVLPIPLNEITLSGGKLTQNPGY